MKPSGRERNKLSGDKRTLTADRDLTHYILTVDADDSSPVRLITLSLSLVIKPLIVTFLLSFFLDRKRKGTQI